MTNHSNNPVYKELKKAFGEELDVTPEQVESYTRHKFIVEQRGRIVAGVASQIFKERYESITNKTSR